MRKSKTHQLKKILFAILIGIALLLLSALMMFTIFYIKTPLNKSKLIDTNLGVEVYNTSADTTPIYYSSDKKIISSTSLNPYTINAFIAIEDKRFYQHNGYDIKRIVKALLVNLKNQSKSQGASTITQQLVKNILLNSEKTYSRKFKELMLAIKTEKTFTKEEILNMYLNSIYFGSNAYGIESASNLYFNKSASKLDINESAILAGIIKSPTYYSPITHPERCFNRKNVVLQQMYNNGYITLEELNENKTKAIPVTPYKNNYINSYNQQAIIEACDLLNITEKELLRQELKIYTYQDSNVQANIEKAVLNSSFANDKLSLVADTSGHVLGYFGDSYYDLSGVMRNPASTLKPLIVYLPAIATNVISPITPLNDEPITDGYAPKNAGNAYMGWISAREALSHSSNVCAVNILNQVGLNKCNEFGTKLNLFNTYQNNPSIALGDVGGGVGVINLARAYSVLQNNGIDKGLTFIEKIEDKNGQILYLNQGYNNQLFNQEDCMLINDMLKTCAKSGTAKRLSDLPFEVASKTGTAQNYDKNTDLWNIAYTTEHLVLSWCGDATSKGLDFNASSSFYPTMINKSILLNLYQYHKPKNFELSEKIVKKAIDSIEYNNNHNITLAPDNALERYIIYDIFKADNLPNTLSSIYEAPALNLNAELTTKGTKFNIETNPAFTYHIYANSNKSNRLIGKYTDGLYDEKVFSYPKIDYYIVAKNIYTDKIYESEKFTLNPQEFLVEKLNNDYLNKNRQTKKRWYV